MQPIEILIMFCLGLTYETSKENGFPEMKHLVFSIKLQMDLSNCKGETEMFLKSVSFMYNWKGWSNSILGAKKYCIQIEIYKDNLSQL